jgi:hypothetical protein
LVVTPLEIEKAFLNETGMERGCRGSAAAMSQRSASGVAALNRKTETRLVSEQ